MELLSLSIHLLEGYEYRAERLTFPVVAELTTREPVLIASAISPYRVTLTPEAPRFEDEYFGLVARPGIPARGLSWLVPEKPEFLVYDVLENFNRYSCEDEDVAPEDELRDIRSKFRDEFRGFRPGDYTLVVALRVMPEKHRPQEVSDTMKVTLAP